MSLTYAIADLHGRFDLLQDAFAKIGDYASAPGTVVTMGDYVDRGPRSNEVIERLMLGVSDGWKLVCLKGNHEDIMLQALRDPSKMGWWQQNGGGQTLASYGGMTDIGHVQWIDDLPLYHEDARRVFVHAWAHPTMPLSEQRTLQCYHGEPALFWTLYRDDDHGGHLGKHVVHGHHQHAHGPIRMKDRTNLDTFAWATGRLVIGVFDDDKAGGPIDFIEIKGKPDARFADAA
jgi:serine/threonine protein phosphatase 1